MNREEAKKILRELLSKTTDNKYSKHDEAYVDFLYNNDFKIVDVQFDKEMAEEKKKGKQSEFMREWEECKSRYGITLSLMDGINKLVELIDKHKEDR